MIGVPVFETETIQRMIKALGGVCLLLLLVSGCADDGRGGEGTVAMPTVSEGLDTTPDTPQPTTTPLPLSTATAAAEASETTQAEGQATASGTLTSTSTPHVFTPTPYPGDTPTPGPLNAVVPTVPAGEYECGAYPCFEDVRAWESRIQLPPGFSVRYVTQIEPHPTSFTFGPDGLLYVARQEGEIVTVDAQGNVTPYVDGFYHLVSLAFQPGTEKLFAASRAVGDEEAIIWLIEDGEAERLYEELPCCYGGWHQANGIAFGPDGYGYVPLGALSDHGERQPLHPLEASILRFDPAGGDIQVYARGLRNTFDIAWDGSGRLFGADNMPDHGPPEEFNRIEAGAHHGFPYYGCQTCTPTPADLEIVQPLHELLAHSAPTGVTAYLHEQFPGYYNNLFLALWSAFPGAQKIVRFGPNGQGMTDFATGFAAPVDVTVGPQGSLFAVDWATGIIFEIRYTGG